jgi:hypothetical protein
MRDLVVWMLGLGLAVNGLVMLGFPADWYPTVPGVIDVGPFNAHFIRDIGVAYLVRERRWCGLRSRPRRGRLHKPVRHSSRCTPWSTCGTPRPDASTSINC